MNSDTPVISVLVPCYNNQCYIYENLRSIFCQTYPAIEILIGDDASRNFNEKELIEWINVNRTENIVDIRIFALDENVGTVANLEMLQGNSKGDLLFNIAADDALYDKDTLQILYDKLTECGPDCEVVIAETEMWDAELSHCIGHFITEENARIICESSPHDLFVINADHVILPASYLYRRSVLKKIGTLSGVYRLVEDVPSILRLLRQNTRIVYSPLVPSIKHRDGGISHGNSRQSKKTLIYYYDDILKIYPNEVKPYGFFLTEEEKRKLRRAHHERIIKYITVRLPFFNILYAVYHKVKSVVAFFCSFAKRGLMRILRIER